MINPVLQKLGERSQRSAAEIQGANWQHMNPCTPRFTRSVILILLPRYRIKCITCYTFNKISSTLSTFTTSSSIYNALARLTNTWTPDSSDLRLRTCTLHTELQSCLLNTYTLRTKSLDAYAQQFYTICMISSGILDIMHIVYPRGLENVSLVCTLFLYQNNLRFLPCVNLQ